MSEQERVAAHGGQVWRRKRDGKLIRLVRFDPTWCDWYWEGHDWKGRGSIYDYNLPLRYEIHHPVATTAAAGEPPARAMAEDALEAMVKRVAVAHVMTDEHAGNGYTEPREAWVECSCGTTVWVWQQHYAETEADPEENKRVHIAAMAVRATLTSLGVRIGEEQG